MICDVLVEVNSFNTDKLFEYRIPSDMIDKIKVGIRCEVPFGNRIINGFIMSIKDSSNYSKDLKSIIRLLDDEALLNDELIELAYTMKKDTLSSLISCLEVMLPRALKVSSKNSISKKIDVYYKVRDDINLDDYKFNDTQKLIIDKCRNDLIIRKELIDISLSSLNTLIKKDILISKEIDSYRLSHDRGVDEKFELTDDQKNSLDSILNTDKLVSLVYGVTGSGKTLLYMELIEKYLNMGKTAIVLVPEISLTTQLIERFTNRFGNKIAAIHSRLSIGEKYDEWRRIKSGEAKIVIGARSAIFAPLDNIGIIIIDEEHSDSYKQSDKNPRYSAKNIAILRAKYHDAKVVMGSATPTMESMYRGLNNTFNLCYMLNRTNNMELPKVKIIDSSKELRYGSGHFSKELILEIENRIKVGEQVILLLNRRGYSSFVTCKSCGHTIKCPNCDISLTYHKRSNNLRCHYCGYATRLDEKCPECGEKAINDLGVGTEKVEEELKKLVNCKILRMDYDTTTRKGSHDKMIRAFKNHEYDVLIGTQMVSKGLDFPLVTLVGVINADTSLNIPDFRSSESTFSLLNQVSGRAGRSVRPGRIIIQTFNPDHYAIKYASKNDYMGFYREELSIRKKLDYPPYSYLTHIRISGKDDKYILEEANKIRNYISKKTNITILGPSPSIIFRVNNIYRYGIILKYKKIDNIKNILLEVLSHYSNNNKIKIDIDFNPTHMF